MVSRRRAHLLLLVVFAAGIVALAGRELVLIGSTAPSGLAGAAVAFAMVARKTAVVICASVLIGAHTLGTLLLDHLLRRRRGGLWLAHAISGAFFGAAALALVLTNGSASP